MADKVPTYTECRNPATGEITGKIPCTTEDELSRIFALCRAAQPAWAAAPVKERAKTILKARDYILDNVVIKNDNIEMVLDPNGKISISNTEELIDLIEQLLTALETTTVATSLGPQALSKALDGTITTIKTKVSTFKI